MRKLAVNLAGCTGAVLLVMAIVSLVTGATQEAHEHFALPEAYALGLLAHANATRAVFALDVGFIVLYTGMFAALAGYLRDRGRPFVQLALGLLILTALLDFVEDHHIVAMLDGADHALLPSAGAIAFQVVESEVKFSVSYLALFLFGLAIPRDTKLGLALSLYLTAGTLLEAVIGYALPPSSLHAFDGGRWIGFLVGLALAIAWLLTQPDAPVPARAPAITPPGAEPPRPDPAPPP